MKIASAPAYRPAIPEPSAPPAWHSLLTHTHMLQGELSAPQNIDNVIAWMQDRGIDAMGVGSPFTPTTRRHYARYEEEMRGIYYRPDFDHMSVKDEEGVQDLIRALNRAGGDRVLIYLDNETPKARYGHMWWVGWQHDFPEWHDYDQPFDRWMCHEQAPGDHGPEPMPYERRPYMEIVAAQRRHGAMGIWAHPTSWWRSPQGAFITNIASEMPAHLAADGFIDGLVIMGYDAYRPSYLDLWLHLLDLGYEVLGVAETDVGLSSRKIWDIDPLLLTWIRNRKPSLSLASISESLKSGEAYASSGPSIQLDVDGVTMGGRIETAPGRNHLVTIQAGAGRPGGKLGRLELVGRGGRILWSVDQPDDGAYTVPINGDGEAGYVLARVFGREDLPGIKADRDIRRFAITNPVYLRPAGWRPPAPVQTDVRIAIPQGSRFADGTVRFESAGGNLIEKGALRGGDNLDIRMPASGRVTLTAGDGYSECRYLINANPAVTELQRYLYRGGFLVDHPQTRPGYVPVEAFRVTAFRDALTAVTITA